MIVMLKSISVGIKLLKKVEETNITKSLDAAVSRSLFTISSIATLHVIMTVLGQVDLSEACLISIWLFVAELNYIFFSLLKWQPIT